MEEANGGSCRHVFDQLLTIEKKDDHLAVCYLSFEASYGYKG
jgi:hypothetical protein